MTNWLSLAGAIFNVVVLGWLLYSLNKTDKQNASKKEQNETY
jgi:hypothetical protein